MLFPKPANRTVFLLLARVVGTRPSTAEVAGGPEGRGSENDAPDHARATTATGPAPPKIERLHQIEDCSPSRRAASMTVQIAWNEEET